MSRYRCLLVGLLATLALAGCGGGDRASRPTCDRLDASFGEPAVRLTFQAPGASSAQVDQARKVLCARLDGLDVAHRVQRAPAGGLTVDVTRASQLAGELERSSIFGAGRLAIYDWEANVLGPRGAPAPGDPEVTGGADAGRGASLSLSDAVRRAARRPVAVEADNSRAGSLFYAVDPRSGEVFARPGAAQAGAPTRSAALAAVPAKARARAKVYEVNPDTVVVRAEGSSSGAGSWYALRDDVALRGSHIVDPQQRQDEGPGATGEPMVTFEFTPEGRTIWAGLTREIADRGSAAVGVLPGQPAVEANQHFAIVVDDAIVSVPYIDFRMNPEGIDGSNGSQITGGFTILSARVLAVLLAGEPLPVSLELVGSSTAP